MTTCINEETLQAHLDGELPAASSAQVIKHLAACDACASKAFTLEQAILLIGKVWDDELPDAAPTERLRARISAALDKEAVFANPARTKGLRQRVSDTVFSALNGMRLSPLRVAFAVLIAVAVCCALWVGIKGRSLPQKGNEQAKTTPNVAAPDRNPAVPEPSTMDYTPGFERASNGPNSIAGTPAPRDDRTPRPRRKIRPRVDDPFSGERDEGAQRPLAADFREADARTDGGLFGPDMIRHFEKVQMLLRSFRNADPSGREFTADLAHERLRSKNLLFQNILLRRNAESSGNVPAEEVMASLEPILLDIANLSERPTSDEVRAIKERIHNKEIIGVLQVYSAPMVATN